MRNVLIPLALLGMSLAAAAPVHAGSSATAPAGGGASQPRPTGDIVAVATEAGSFKVLLKAVQAAGLVETLQGAGPFTVFAPTDEAFAKLPPGALDKLLANPELLKAVLTSHVVAKKVMAADVLKLDGVDVATVSGEKVKVSLAGGQVRLTAGMTSATVSKTDVGASNGVIHVLDAVLVPDALAAQLAH